MFGKPKTYAVVAVGCFLVELTLPALAQAQNANTILYFLRHTETQTRLVSDGEGHFVEDCNPSRSCCADILNPLGIARRNALGDWFAQNRLVGTLTHLIASNKPRTVETLAAIAALSGLPVEQYPSDTAECDPGFETARDSMPFVIAAIMSLPTGSRPLIANHGDTLYDIIEATSGLDTSDDVFFPKEPGTRRVRGFNQLWVVQVDANRSAKLLQHVEFDVRIESAAPSYLR